MVEVGKRADKKCFVTNQVDEQKNIPPTPFSIGSSSE